jgi:hypothetical protein
MSVAAYAVKVGGAVDVEQHRLAVEKS